MSHTPRFPFSLHSLLADQATSPESSEGGHSEPPLGGGAKSRSLGGTCWAARGERAVIQQTF